MLILIIFVRFLDLRLVRDKVVAAFADTKARTLSEASRNCALEQIVAENIQLSQFSSACQDILKSGI